MKRVVSNLGNPRDAGKQIIVNLLFFTMLVILVKMNAVDAWIQQRQRQKYPRPTGSCLFSKNPSQIQQRQRKKLVLKSGNKAPLLSRTVPITSDWSITVWEWETPAQVVEGYWQAQRQVDISIRDKNMLLDPFGIVSWPGSVIAARALQQYKERVVQDQDVLVLGAGVGVETQAAAMLGARSVLATDIHPTTLQQLALGVEEEPNIPDGIVQTHRFDIFDMEQQPIPKSDLLVVADVLYNEQLASQVVRRVVEAWVQNPDICILVTDSQRFVDFCTELNEQLELVQGPAPVQWTEESFEFTGSGVCIDEEQTYDVKVRTLWIGLD